MKASDITILFADDNVSIQKVYEKNFVRDGFKVLLAEHGARAMAELHEQKVDLLVTDMVMPGMDTLELFSIINKEFPRLPIIVVSGRYADLKDDFQKKGFNVKAFFGKPVGINVLKEKVNEIFKIVPAPNRKV
jgi:DNA-binding NtrC family response regulator